MYAMTAAHRKLPFGTIVRVINPASNKIVLVRINDRGPFIRKRIIDLSLQSAKEIGGVGLPNVRIEALLPNSHPLVNGQGFEYYYGYSIDKPLTCIPRNFLDIIDSCSAFDQALKIYNEISNYDNNIYIFTSSQKLSLNDKGCESKKYFIAKIATNQKPQKYIETAQNIMF
jgi:hypothetical protein